MVNSGQNQAQNPGQAPPGAGHAPEDPGANTQMFQAYASTRSAEPEKNRVTMLLVAAGLFVVAVIIIVALFMTG